MRGATTSPASPPRPSTGSSSASASRSSRPRSFSRGGHSWRERAADFDDRPDRWLNHLAQAAEWFPLLGLIGTVAAILQTFSSITPGSRPEPSEIIRKYAPAITATGSGLFMAFINILPIWVVNVGRDLIRAPGSAGYAAPEPARVPATPGGTP